MWLSQALCWSEWVSRAWSRRGTDQRNPGFGQLTLHTKTVCLFVCLFVCLYLFLIQQLAIITWNHKTTPYHMHPFCHGLPNVGHCCTALGYLSWFCQKGTLASCQGICTSRCHLDSSSTLTENLVFFFQINPLDPRVSSDPCCCWWSSCTPSYWSPSPSTALLGRKLQSPSTPRPTMFGARLPVIEQLQRVHWNKLKKHKFPMPYLYM